MVQTLLQLHWRYTCTLAAPLLCLRVSTQRKPMYTNIRDGGKTVHVHTGNALYWKFEINIPRNESARPRSLPISTFMYLWAFYRLPRKVRKCNTARQAERTWEYINRSQIHECRYWQRGRAVSFLGIFGSLCSAARCGVQYSVLTWCKG